MQIRAWLILAGITLARIAFGFQFQAVASLGPRLAGIFHFDYATLGTLIGLYMLPGLFVALPGGLLARRLGDSALMITGLVLMVLGGALPGLVPSLPALGAGRVMAGTGAVLMSVLQAKILADWFPGRAFVIAVGVSVGAFPLGVGLCQIAAPWLAATLGWQSVLGGGAGLGAAALVLFAASFRPAHGAPDLRRFALPSRRECTLVLLAGLVWTFYNTGYFGFLSWLPSLMRARGHGDALTGATLALATWGNLPAILLGGALAARFGNGRIFTVGMVALTLTTASIALSDRPLAWGTAFGTLGAIQTGVIMAAGALSARPENRAVGMGMFYTVYYLGGTAMPAVCGWAADRFGGPSAALLTAAAVSALALPAWSMHQRLACDRRGWNRRRHESRA